VLLILQLKDTTISFSFKNERAKKQILRILKTEIHQNYDILYQLRRLIHETPDMIGYKWHEFYIIFDKFRNSNATFILEKYQRDRDTIKEWMSEEERNELRYIKSKVNDIENQIRELTLESKMLSIDSFESY
jgi:ATP-dependent 26S proteasome regulatory subunit